jgi:hypothetical protein
MPLIIEETLCEIVSTNMESCLLGITFAVLILFDELIEIETDPRALEPSSITIKHPF